MKLIKQNSMIMRIVFSFLVLCSIIACVQKSPSKEIVFVCTHGAARSPIAAAYFNKMASENDLNFHAIFRGTEPDDALSAATVKGLSKDGFDISNWKPEKVSLQEIKKAYQIVTFDCAVPLNKTEAQHEAWNGTPAISTDYSVARDAIKERVIQLVETLNNN